MSEKAVKIAATLYHARDSARLLFGDCYAERCAFWRDSINRVMQRRGCDEMVASIELAKELNQKGGSPLVLLAATVEMIEGIFAPPPIGSVIKYRQTHPAHPGRVAEGKAEVRRYLTAANAPAPHMRPPERMLFVRGCDHGKMHGQHFIVKASEVVTS